MHLSYKLPKEGKTMEESPDIASPTDYERRIQLPVSAEMLEECAVGDTCQFMLVGEIVETRNTASEEYDGGMNVTLKITEVVLDHEDEEEAFRNGFDRKNTHY